VTSHCDALRLRPVTRFNEPHVVYVQVSDPAFDAHQTDLLAITATSSTWFCQITFASSQELPLHVFCRQPSVRRDPVECFRPIASTSESPRKDDTACEIETGSSKRAP
jgi:hypothetical protein